MPETASLQVKLAVTGPFRQPFTFGAGVSDTVIVGGSSSTPHMAATSRMVRVTWGKVDEEDPAEGVTATTSNAAVPRFAQRRGRFKSGLK